MRIVIAPDSFKGSLTSREVSDAIGEGILEVASDAEVVKVPMADGGEGTVQALIDSSDGENVRVTVRDPLLRKIDAFYGLSGDGRTAFIEMAAASGLPLLKEEEKNPAITSTYGTGELIRHALDQGCGTIILAIGGSATNDGGSGMLKALGASFLDGTGADIGEGGVSLKKLKTIDLSAIDERIKDVEFIVASDVDNPLCGERGASQVFAPQKGADAKMVSELEEGLRTFADVTARTVGRDLRSQAGSGAAGGLGFGLLSFLDAELKKGIDMVIELSGLEKEIAGADLVITGEGQMDFQTAFGKTPYGVAKVAQTQGVPVVALCGQLGERYEELYGIGFTSIFSIVDKPMTLKESMDRTGELLKRQTMNIIRLAMLSS